jgi:hypothetical protein
VRFWIASPSPVIMVTERVVRGPRNHFQKTPLLFACRSVGLFLLVIGLTVAPAAPAQSGSTKKCLSVLIQIYAEVKELGPYPGEDFVRREFFVGEDDDDTNKDIHVMVLIQPAGLKEMMFIRVTEMVKDPSNPQARLAASSKMLSCLIAGGRAEIRSSDYKHQELEKLAPEILTAIQSKKRLLKVSLFGNARPG